MPALFSVIIPTFNRQSLVSATLDSVFAQEHSDYEVIVVDDGSTDQTLDVVRRCGDRVAIYQQDHRGCAAARNLGARHAAGRYLAFLDSDDLWFPWTLKVFAKAIERHDDPAFVGGRLTPFQRETDLKNWAEAELETLQAVDFFAATGANRFGLGVAHGVVLRDAYLGAGGCEELNVNGTDGDVLLKLGDAPGYAIIKQPFTLAYRKHGGATTKNHDKSLAGVRMVLNKERQRLYPGGDARRRERLVHILARTRGVSREAISEGRPDVAWRIYLETFFMNLSLMRMQYLIAMPPLILCALLRKLLGGSPSRSTD